MWKHQRTSIDDLTAVGQELAEIHLALAAGGATKMSSRGHTVTCANGGRVLDPISD